VAGRQRLVGSRVAGRQVGSRAAGRQAAAGRQQDGRQTGVGKVDSISYVTGTRVGVRFTKGRR
jgi:hypothetical protein